MYCSDFTTCPFQDLWLVHRRSQKGFSEDNQIFFQGIYKNCYWLLPILFAEWSSNVYSRNFMIKASHYASPMLRSIQNKISRELRDVTCWGNVTYQWNVFEVVERHKMLTKRDKKFWTHVTIRSKKGKKFETCNFFP